jgi:hypothetical protein
MNRKLWSAAIVLALLFSNQPAPVPTVITGLQGPRAISKLMYGFVACSGLSNPLQFRWIWHAARSESGTVSQTGICSRSIERASDQATRSESDSLPVDIACFTSLGMTTMFSSTDASAVQQAIDVASDGDVVKVAGYCAGVSVRDGITQTAVIEKSLTIRGGYTNTNWIDFDPAGRPTTLDAQMNGRVMYVTGDIHTTIEGLRLTGGNAQNWGSGLDGNAGGGIYIVTATVTLSGSEVFGNSAGQGLDAPDQYGVGGNGGSGGGIYNDGILTIQNSVLHNNRAGNGGSAVDYTGVPGSGGSGGSIYNNQTLSVVNSVIAASQAGDGAITHSPPGTNFGSGGDGGGIYNNNWLHLTASHIISNGTGSGYRNGYGGGVFNHGSMIIISGTVDENYTRKGVYPGYHFGSNGGDGGGFYNEGTLQVVDTSFSGNFTGEGAVNLRSGGGGNGGGIANSGTLNIVEGMMHDNQTGASYSTTWGGNLGSYGGGIYSRGSLTLISSTLTTNQTGAAGYGDSASGGAVAVLWGDAQLSQNTATSNTAAYRGGGFYFSASNVVMTNTLVTNNSAGYSGSGFAAFGSSVVLKHATLARNHGGDGSGISVEGNSNVDLINLIVAQHTVGITASMTNTVHVTGVLWFNNTKGNVSGSGHISVTRAFTGSPAFVDPSAGNFHLTSASAAINRGVATGVPIDLDGAARDTAPDLGAYEYQWARRFYLPTIRRQ